jgi:hypothetical protein
VPGPDPRADLFVPAKKNTSLKRNSLDAFHHAFNQSSPDAHRDTFLTFCGDVSGTILVVAAKPRRVAFSGDVAPGSSARQAVIK